MKIRGNTVGTPISPERVLCAPKELTEEQKAQARENIGALTEAEMKAYVEQEILGGAW